MAVPLIAGRDIAWTDTSASPGVAVVSQTFARSFWPNQDAIGKRFKRGRPGDNQPWITIVGVVGDVRQLDLIRVPRPAMYFSALQDATNAGDRINEWAIRTSGDPMALAPSLRTAVWSVDSSLPVTRVQTMDDIRSAATASQQFNLLLVGVFAVLALVLAAVGLYGVTSYSVEQRTRELGIRLALGAQRAELLRLVLAQGTRLAVIGLAGGAMAALVLTRFMSALLFGIGARDPLTFAGVSLLLLAVSLVAAFIPAHRATRVDPVIALRT
jgi:predicted permease